MYKKIYKSMNMMAIFTLLITAVLVLTVCYSIFNSRLKSEIKSEATIISDIINNTGSENFLYDKNNSILKDKRITLIQNNGIVLFDSMEDSKKMGNHLSRPEVLDAINKGTGVSKRHSDTLGTNVLYYAVKLDDGNILRIASVSNDMMFIFLGILIPIVIMVILIYILCRFFSRNLTKNIIQPINDISLTSNDYDNVYDELVPFIKRIAGQNQEISHQTEKVKREKLRLQAISDNMSEGLIVLDDKKDIIAANESIFNIFDVSWENISHRYGGILSGDPDYNICLKKAFDGEKCNVPIEINEKTYRAFFSPVYENEFVSGVIILLFDISEEMKASKIRKEFSANVSHELKTPLTTILGYSQIINNDIAKAEDIKNFTQKIEKEASRLITLIDDIINLSRLDEEEDKTEKTKIHLNAIINEVIERLENKANEKNVEIIYDEKDTIINANLSQITELIYNLCDNAVKYNKDNGKVEILVSDKKFVIKDTGIGIPKEYIPRIFERFFRVDKSRSKKVNGTGLGLSIVKHIAKQNNAEILVESELGKGTIFTVAFK